MVPGGAIPTWPLAGCGRLRIMLYSAFMSDDGDKLDLGELPEAPQNPITSSPAAIPVAPASVVARKPGAPKEVPPFRWKIVGYSHGIPLVLFKSAEQADAEAQLPRYQEEGYYSDLAMHPVEKKIPLPKDVVLAPHAKLEPVRTKPPKKKPAEPAGPPVGTPKAAVKSTAEQKSPAQEASASKMQASTTKAAKSKAKAKVKPAPPAGGPAAEKTAKTKPSGKAKTKRAMLKKPPSTQKKTSPRKQTTR